ncbi:MAG: hypothetical protein PVG03_13605 [Desulfarculaceae bacterium]|jgi:hypothetical protein
MDAATIWDTLYRAARDMESSGGDWQVKLATVMAAVELFMEFPPQEIVAQIETSELPTRAVVSWLVFEGGRMKTVEPSQVQGLKEYWESICQPGQGIQPPPKGVGFF